MTLNPKTLSKIRVNNMRVYAHHGCLSEERSIGSYYRVDVSVKADLGKSCKTDNLQDTVNYVSINDIVCQEMDLPSNLLEHVAQRILDKILDLERVEHASVLVSKINPPICGDVASACVKLKGSKKSI